MAPTVGKSEKKKSHEHSTPASQKKKSNAPSTPVSEKKKSASKSAPGTEKKKSTSKSIHASEKGVSESVSITVHEKKGSTSVSLPGRGSSSALTSREEKRFHLKSFLAGLLAGIGLGFLGFLFLLCFPLYGKKRRDFIIGVIVGCIILAIALAVLFILLASFGFFQYNYPHVCVTGRC